MAFGVMAISGVLINFSLALTRGTEAIGVFNQTMAFFVIASHFAVFGIHNAVLYFCAAYPTNARQILRKALGPLIVIAGFMTTVSVFASPVIANLLDSEPLALSLQLASLALFFFAFNKVGLAALNATLRMRAFAVGQALRYVLILLVSLYIGMYGVDLKWLGSAFLTSEVVLSFFLMIVLKRNQLSGQRSSSGKLSRLILRFSYRSAGAGLLNQINLSGDKLMLGYFMSDQVVGIYSFATIFVEGFYCVGLVIRNILNPYLTKALKANDFDLLTPVVRRLHPFNFLLSTAVVLSVYLLFDPIVIEMLGLSDFGEAKNVILVIFAFMAIYFLFIPFEEIILVSGNPVAHTWIYIGVIATNILLNLLLIPSMGMIGAAMATGTSFMMMMVCVSTYSYVRLRLNLITGRGVF